MSNLWSRYLSLIFSGGLALAAFGCGDDDGGGNRPDARPQVEDDAGPDGGVPFLRSGTIAVTEAAITNTIGVGDPWSGGLVRVDFGDATTGNAPAPVAGFDSVINNCLIRIWDVGTHEGSDPVDEGVVSVTGTENGPFACAFVSALGTYACQSTTAAVAGGVAGNLNGVTTVNGLMTFGAAGTQTAPEMVGQYMLVNGHPTIPEGSRLPIIGQNTPADTLQVAGLPNVNLGAGDADSTFTNFVGVGPLPTGTQFLLGMADAISVQKAAGQVVPAIDQDFNAHGQGFQLLDDPTMAQYLPHTVPFTAGEVNFACAAAGCGAEGSGGLIEAIVINGETTDGTVEGPLNPADPMPDPVEQYATFQCAFISSDVATMTTEMMDAILGTNPSRIQVSVGRYRGAVADQDQYAYNIFQGHAVLGWSTRPPE